jgi:hypothetical protein
MHLIIVLRLLASENGVERDLIALVHDRAVAAHHFADVKMRDAGNGLQEFVRAGDDFLGGVRFCRVGPENDNVRKHDRQLNHQGAKAQRKISFSKLGVFVTLWLKFSK